MLQSAIVRRRARRSNALARNTTSTANRCTSRNWPPPSLPSASSSHFDRANKLTLPGVYTLYSCESVYCRYFSIGYTSAYIRHTGYKGLFCENLNAVPECANLYIYEHVYHLYSAEASALHEELGLTKELYVALSRERDDQLEKLKEEHSSQMTTLKLSVYFIDDFKYLYALFNYFYS